jgi:hypothetical protein
MGNFTASPLKVRQRRKRYKYLEDESEKKCKISAGYALLMKT